MADIQFSCDNCKKSLVVSAAAAGRVFTCPQCTTEVRVPSGKVPNEPHRLDVDFGTAYSLDQDVDGTSADPLGEFRKLNYAKLIPVGEIFSPALLRRRAVRWILLFGLLPLVLAWLARQFDFRLSDILWAMLLYFCLFWALYFFSVIQPSRENWMRGVGYAAFTATVGGSLLFASHNLPIIRSFYSSDIASLGFLKQLFGFVFIVGVLEESCKALPLLVFGLRSNRIRSARDGVFLGLLSGFGFAASEGVSYVQGATINAVNFGYINAQLLTILDRVITGPLQHGTWAGIVGWFIATAARRPSGQRWPVVVVGIGLSSILHGLFNTFSGGLIGIAIAALGFVAFMAYLVHGDVDPEPPSRVGAESAAQAA